MCAYLNWLSLLPIDRRTTETDRQKKCKQRNAETETHYSGNKAKYIRWCVLNIDDFCVICFGLYYGLRLIKLPTVIINWDLYRNNLMRSTQKWYGKRFDAVSYIFIMAFQFTPLWGLFLRFYNLSLSQSYHTHILRNLIHGVNQVSVFYAKLFTQPQHIIDGNSFKCS